MKFCSKSCRRAKPSEIDGRLEDAILKQLRARARGATICPSEAARSVEPEQWRDLMEPTRAAARRLVAQGKIEITQKGRPVDPSTARGPLLAAESGILFMPNHQRDVRDGDDAYFVVRRVGRVWLRLSAFVRRRETIHLLLPVLLPGVRRRSGHARDLLIDPEIAAVFRRELFHLLGYRLVRFWPTPGLSPLARARRATALALRALARITGNLIRRGSTDANHTERESDWIVRRHSLDQSRQIGSGF